MNDIVNKLSEIVGENGVCRAGEPMAEHVTFRCGGKAAVYVAPAPECDFAGIKELFEYIESTGMAYEVIGRGSNLLVADEGYPGILVDFSKTLGNVCVEGETIRAEAGVPLIGLCREAAKQSLAGLEFASGIPGTVGGAVAMNAGAYGGEMKNVIRSAHILARTVDEVGRKHFHVLEVTGDELELSYRNSRLLRNHEFLLDVTVQLERDSEEAIRERMEDLKKKRQEKQPLEYPSAGSTFKRPEGYFAGKLIMDSGLAGYRVGGAMVSEKHCGFVINYDGASATDVLTLCKDVREKVLERFGVEMELEVKVLR